MLRSVFVAYYRRMTPLTPIFDYKPRKGNITVGNTPGVPAALATTLTFISEVLDNDMLSTARGIVIKGNHAIVAGPFADILADNSNRGGLTVVDVSNPASMPIVETLLLDDSWDLERYGTNYAVVARRQANSVSVVDISDPTNLSTVGTVTHATQLSVSFGVKVSGTHAFVAAYGGNRLTAVNLSNPASPSITSSLNDATNLNQPADLAINGDYAYVSSATQDRLTVVDISNPASMSVVGSVQNATTLNGSEGVGYYGGYVYVGADQNDTLTVVDVSNPASPSIVTAINTGMGGAAGIDIVGTLCFVSCGAGGTGVAVYDLSTPSAPTLIDSIAPTEIWNSFGIRYVGDLTGGYVYTTSYNGNSFHSTSFT